MTEEVAHKLVFTSYDKGVEDTERRIVAYLAFAQKQVAEMGDRLGAKESPIIEEYLKGLLLGYTLAMDPIKTRRYIDVIKEEKLDTP